MRQQSRDFPFYAYVMLLVVFFLAHAPLWGYLVVSILYALFAKELHYYCYINEDEDEDDR